MTEKGERRDAQTSNFIIAIAWINSQQPASSDKGWEIGKRVDGRSQEAKVTMKECFCY